MICTHVWTVLKFGFDLGLDFVFVCLFRFSIFVVFHVRLDHFIIPFLGTFIVLGSVSSVPRWEIGWEERVQNDSVVTVTETAAET